MSKGGGMQIEAIFHKDGHIELPASIRLKRVPATVQVILSDDLVQYEFEELDQVLAESQAMLGSDYAYVPSEKSKKDVLLEALEEKYSR
jgi:hypothetical protein